RWRRRWRVALKENIERITGGTAIETASFYQQCVVTRKWQRRRPHIGTGGTESRIEDDVAKWIDQRPLSAAAAAPRRHIKEEAIACRCAEPVQIRCHRRIQVRAHRRPGRD